MSGPIETLTRSIEDLAIIGHKLFWWTATKSKRPLHLYQAAVFAAHLGWRPGFGHKPTAHMKIRMRVLLNDLTADREYGAALKRELKHDEEKAAIEEKLRVLEKIVIDKPMPHAGEIGRIHVIKSKEI